MIEKIKTLCLKYSNNIYIQNCTVIVVLTIIMILLGG
jgi:hypothetical protein